MSGPRWTTWPSSSSTPTVWGSWATPPVGPWPSGLEAGPGRWRGAGGGRWGGAARSREASPLERLPIGAPQVLVHGEDDEIVPVRQSEGYAAAARAAGDQATFTPVPDAGHFQLIDVPHPPSREVLRSLQDLTPTSG